MTHPALTAGLSLSSGVARKVGVTSPLWAGSEYHLAVFLLYKRRKPLMACSEKQARLLLTRGRAIVHRPVAELLAGKPAMEAGIKAHAGAPLKDAAAVNAPHCGYAWRPALPAAADAGGLQRRRSG